ncbi:MAG: hypothetical protein K2H88_09560 [Duncaniella sp.]|nr:hypothetical protein [Duncaniella sp.]MDE6327318.1 hypothetical protein [Duncaniella sp.]
MASNKRLLKKEIRTICGALAGECVIAKLTIPGVNPESFNQIIYKLADLQESAIRLVSVEFPQSPSSFDNKKAYADARHAYFKEAFAKLEDNFNKRVEELVKEMNAALPDEQKIANKEAVAASKK